VKRSSTSVVPLPHVRKEGCQQSRRDYITEEDFGQSQIDQVGRGQKQVRPGRTVSLVQFAEMKCKTADQKEHKAFCEQ
jgi:hypothetical protein